jgi:hypothetical protein
MVIDEWQPELNRSGNVETTDIRVPLPISAEKNASAVTLTFAKMP